MASAWDCLFTSFSCLLAVVTSRGWPRWQVQVVTLRHLEEKTHQEQSVPATSCGLNTQKLEALIFNLSTLSRFPLGVRNDCFAESRSHVRLLMIPMIPTFKTVAREKLCVTAHVVFLLLQGKRRICLVSIGLRAFQTVICAAQSKREHHAPRASDAAVICCDMSGCFNRHGFC